MTIYTDIMVFCMIWMVLLFVVLPLGISVDPNPQVGNAKSAPSNPKIGKKLLIVTLVTIPVYALLKWLIASGLLQRFI